MRSDLDESGSQSSWWRIALGVQFREIHTIVERFRIMRKVLSVIRQGGF